MPFTPHTVPTFPYQPQQSRIQILPADAQAQKTIATAGGNGSKLIGLNVSSTDTVARDVTLSLTNGGTSYPLATKTIPIGAGTVAGTPPVNLLDPAVIPGLPVDSDGNSFLFMVSGDTLTANALVTVTAAKAITLHATFSDF